MAAHPSFLLGTNQQLLDKSLQDSLITLSRPLISLTKHSPHLSLPKQFAMPSNLRTLGQLSRPKSPYSKSLTIYNASNLPENM
jgi:hypothetical protein